MYQLHNKQDNWYIKYYILQATHGRNCLWIWHIDQIHIYVIKIFRHLAEILYFVFFPLRSSSISDISFKICNWKVKWFGRVDRCRISHKNNKAGKKNISNIKRQKIISEKPHLIVLSEPPLTISLSLYCKHAMPLLCPLNVLKKSQVEVDQTFIVRSPDPETM